MALLLGVLMMKNKHIFLGLLFLGFQSFASESENNAIVTAVSVGNDLVDQNSSTALVAQQPQELSPEFLERYRNDFSEPLKAGILSGLQNPAPGRVKETCDRALSQAVSQAADNLFALRSLDSSVASIDGEMMRMLTAQGGTINIKELSEACVAAVCRVVDDVARDNSQAFADKVYPSILVQALTLIQDVLGRKINNNSMILSIGAQAGGCFLLPFDNDFVRTVLQNAQRAKMILSGATEIVGFGLLLTRGAGAQKFFNDKIHHVMVNGICLLILQQLYVKMVKSAPLKKITQYTLYLYGLMAVQKMLNYAQLMKDRAEMVATLANGKTILLSEAAKKVCQEQLNQKINHLQTLLGQVELRNGQEGLFAQGVQTQAFLDAMNQSQARLEDGQTRLEAGQRTLQLTFTQAAAGVAGGFAQLSQQGASQHQALMNAVGANQLRQERLMNANTDALESNAALTRTLQRLLGVAPALIQDEGQGGGGAARGQMQLARR